MPAAADFVPAVPRRDRSAGPRARRGAAARPPSSWIAAAAIAISVLAAGVTLGLHVSFDPYFADPANPAGAEMMTVAMMLAAFVALIERRPRVFLVAAVLAHATLPSGLLFVIVLGAAWFAITRSRSALARDRRGDRDSASSVTLLYEKVYVPHALPPGVAMDAGSESLAGRMRLLIFTDFARLAFLVIPCGIVPAFFLFAWKKQDAIASRRDPRDRRDVPVLLRACDVLAALLRARRWCSRSSRTGDGRGRPLAAWIGLAGALAGLRAVAAAVPRRAAAVRRGRQTASGSRTSAVARTTSRICADRRISCRASRTCPGTTWIRRDPSSQAGCNSRGTRFR